MPRLLLKICRITLLLSLFVGFQLPIVYKWMNYVKEYHMEDIENISYVINGIETLNFNNEEQIENTKIEVITLIGILYKNEKEQFNLNINKGDNLIASNDRIQLYESQLKTLDLLTTKFKMENADEIKSKSIDIIELLKIFRNNEKENFEFNRNEAKNSNSSKKNIRIYVDQLLLLDSIKNILLNESDSKIMTDYVRNMIELNQNPKECKNANVIICKMHDSCAFSCQFHFWLYALSAALHKGKALIIEPSEYVSLNKYEEFFKAISSSCTIKNISKEDPVEYITYYATTKYTPYFTPIVPTQIFQKISKFHSKPDLWWVGQLASYFFRFQPKTMDYIDVTNRKIKPNMPIVGIHVRRGDKIINEAEPHSLSEYLYWADIFFERMKLEKDIKKKYIYLSTDDEQFTKNAQKEYPDYTFITNDEKSIYFAEKRNTKIGALSIINDLHFLSNCDYVVCTMSSNICRLVYELMNSRVKDISENFKSLDSMWFIYGGYPRSFKTLIPHKKRNNMEIDTSMNSIITLSQFEWRGNPKYIVNNSVSGYIPSYKIYEKIKSYPFKAFERRQHL